MKVVVTGHKGFIGQHVTRLLVTQGHEWVGLDLPEVDITKSLEPIPGIDALVHLAALSHPNACEREPGRAFEVNVNGTNNVLRMALQSGVKKVVFSSSGHVYDIPPRYLPTDEAHPLRLNNTYTTTKLLGEELCQLYWENHGLPYTALRLFNVYGPGQALGYFIPDFIAKARAGYPLTLKPDNTTKDWVYVDDVARAFVMALETPFVGSINIGTGIETTLGHIAERIAWEYRVQFTGAPTETATRMCANRGRAATVLGWAPATNLWEGLNATLDAAKAKESVRS